MKKLILTIILSLTATGCAQQTFVMSSDTNSAVSNTPTSKQSQHFFIDGLAQGQEIDAAGVCGGGDKVAKVEVQKTFVNVLLDVITFGIYTPREARIYCKA
ncbi:Bor family protein [Vibrio scophthalmi]|uniref:Putative Bor protein of bacteriophage n=1 Tax=Vibrio scophthalmi LMG 19158 TaxID=870967 RepID=F9RS31_9VIBR|nr:Bor family protein [Vibrio scophthalmi]EGU32535.1 putative Bor protein precursor of bacteriophage [Vibrio scophthalmi LMG 19158]